MIARILPPQCSLIAEVADHLVGDGKDYSANLVVFPGKRPAHFLRKELGRRLRSACMPPQILSMDTFVEQIYASLRIEEAVDAIDAVACLYEIHQAFERRLGGPGFTTLDLFFPIGLQLFRDLEELTIEQVPLEKVKDLGSAADVVIPTASYDRMVNMAAYAERFYAGLRQSGRSTRAMRYCEVARRIGDADLGSFRRIIFAGFFTFTAAERRIVDAMRPLESLVCLFQDGPYLDDRLAALGVSAERVDAGTPNRKVSFLACPDVHGEACALGDMLEKLRKNGEPDERTAVVLPSAETLFPLLRHALAGWEERSFNVTLGYPLARTPVFGFFRALAELVTSMDGDRVYVPAYLAFVLHPYTKNIFFRGSAEVTRILFHTIEDAWSGEASPSFIVPGSAEGDVKLLQKAAERLKGEGHEVSAYDLGMHLGEIHARTITPFLRIASVCDFAEKSIALLEYLHDNSTAQLHPLFFPYVETIVRALDDVRGSALGPQSFSEAAGYFSFFERYLTTCSIPFEGTPLRGLQVLGVLETRSLRFEKVFLLDANEDVLPEARRNDSLLPARARELLGLPTQRDRDQLARYYFSTLVGGADEVTILFIENDRKERSRFVERILWEEEQRSGRRFGDDAYPNLQYRVHLGNRLPGQIKKTEAVVEMLRRHEFSASALDRYLLCPLSFYYHDVLGMRQRDENTGELERSDIGLIVHEALKRFLRGLGGKELSARDLSDKKMSGIVEDIFCKRFGERPFGSGYLLMRQVRRRLADFVDRYLVPLAKKHAVMVLTSEDDLRMRFYDYSLAGRPDAVFGVDGRRVIVDFKTSAQKASYAIAFDKLVLDDRETWNRAVGSIQLPFYIILHSNFSGMPAADIDAVYLMLGMTHIGPGIELPLFGAKDDRVEDMTVLEELLKRILQEIVDASVPFLPVRDLKRGCPFCDYSSICGTQWVAK